MTNITLLSFCAGEAERMIGRDLKAAAVRAGLPLYQVAAEAKINPSHLSRLLNDRVAVDTAQAERIQAAIERLAGEVSHAGAC